jgi:hypothetical protein
MRPSSFTAAGGLLVLSAVAYLGLVAASIPTGRVYLSALGGAEPASLGAVVAVYGTLAVLALVVARRVLAGRVGRGVASAFAGWFFIAAVAALVIGPGAAVGIAVTALLPLAFIWHGRPAIEP